MDIGPKSRTERPKKTKIGTEVAHVTRDSDTTFKVNLQGAEAYCGGLPHSLLLLLLLLNSHVHYGRTLSDASMLYFADVFFLIFLCAP